MPKPATTLQAIAKYRLWLIPPATEGRPWTARTNGGSQDPAPMLGFGDTPAQAVEDAIRGGAEPSSFEARRRLDDAAYRGIVGDEWAGPCLCSTAARCPQHEEPDAFVDPLS